VQFSLAGAGTCDMYYLVLLSTAKFEHKPFDVRYSRKVVLLSSCVGLLLLNRSLVNMLLIFGYQISENASEVMRLRLIVHFAFIASLSFC
jgi:hypothetical protein